MKKIIGLSAIILSALLLLPLTALKPLQEGTTLQAITETDAESSETFRLCFSETDTVAEISAEDYIFGVVAAEMPALYEEEALKAQAVAAYTFALYRKSVNKDKEYDLTDSYLSDQSYITLDEAKERWGENADTYIEKIKTAVDSVKDYAITYNDKPILAVYHAISFGSTENAENVWGKEYPYLKSVDSYGDKLSKDYISTLTVSENDFKEKLKDKVNFNKNENEYLGKSDCTDAGTVKEIKICDTQISGNTVRELFLLRSSNFKINYSEGNFNFTVYGYGHSVGLSQNGANYMAKQGSNFKEILMHYYKNTKIEKLK